MKSIVWLIVTFCLIGQIYCLEYSEIVEISSGKIRGAVERWRDRLAYEFKGIPFAAPPVGSLRYAKPVEPEPWEGIRDTVAYGKSCPQKAWATPFEQQDEDCLYMNVYVNKETFDGRHDQLKPVLFWIHGGGFQAGSGNEHDAYKGIPLVIVEDVVLVTFNYRLGVFGFFNPGEMVPSAVHNLGLWDQNVALHWVQSNIHLFGGDPSQVTIFGQSAGSGAVSAQIISPLSRGLFKGAIMESGGLMIGLGSEENRTLSMAQIIESLNCSDVSDRIACLRSVSWREIMEHIPNGTFLAPTHGDEYLPLSGEEAIAKRKFNDVNLLAGAERDENEGLVCSTYKFAELKASKSTTKTYGYIHTQAPMVDFNKLKDICGRSVDKVCHCDELVYVFGAPLRMPDQYDAADIELSISIMKIWADFARTGKPTRQGPIDWPEIKGPKSDKVVLIDLNTKFIGKIDDVTGTNCRSWEPSNL